MASLAEDFAFPVISLSDFITDADIALDRLLAAYDPRRTAAQLDVQRQRVALNFAWLTPLTKAGQA
jgi:hypothetical protein